MQDVMLFGAIFGCIAVASGLLFAAMIRSQRRSFVKLAVVGLVIAGFSLVNLETESVGYTTSLATAGELAAEAENHRLGFHCLSSWDGSITAFRDAVRDTMRDPDSFEHIETRITPVNETGHHIVFMDYRARNGFGGMNVGRAAATVRGSDCSFEIVAVE